jgi:hypothetical protein
MSAIIPSHPLGIDPSRAPAVALVHGMRAEGDAAAEFG